MPSTTLFIAPRWCWPTLCACNAVLVAAIVPAVSKSSSSCPCVAWLPLFHLSAESSSISSFLWTTLRTPTRSRLQSPQHSCCSILTHRCVCMCVRESTRVYVCTLWVCVFISMCLCAHVLCVCMRACVCARMCVCMQEGWPSKIENAWDNWEGEWGGCPSPSLACKMQDASNKGALIVLQSTKILTKGLRMSALLHWPKDAVQCTQRWRGGCPCKHALARWVPLHTCSMGALAHTRSLQHGYLCTLAAWVLMHTCSMGAHSH